jgi:hypothetical protein
MVKDCKNLSQLISNVALSPKETQQFKKYKI